MKVRWDGPLQPVQFQLRGRVLPDEDRRTGSGLGNRSQARPTPLAHFDDENRLVIHQETNRENLEVSISIFAVEDDPGSNADRNPERLKPIPLAFRPSA